MMPDSRATNRAVFWRVIRRFFGATPGGLLVLLLALGGGAAVPAALLNLQVDAKRPLTTEFRRFGANVLISSRESTDLGANRSLNPSFLDNIPDSYEGGEITKVGFTHVAIVAHARNSRSSSDDPREWSSVILVGLDGHNVQHVLPSDFVETSDRVVSDISTCRIGPMVAKRLHVHPGEILDLPSNPFATTCYVSSVESFGGSEDSQIFTDWYTCQRLAGLPNPLTIIHLTLPSPPPQIQSFIAALQQRFPDVDVRPIRQFTEGEAKIYNRISGLLTATVGIVLLLTGLCVMAALTHVAMERKMDVGLMK